MSGVCSCLSAVCSGNRLSWWSVKGEEPGAVICRVLLCAGCSFPLGVTPILLGCVHLEAEKAPAAAEKALGEKAQRQDRDTQ